MKDKFKSDYFKLGITIFLAGSALIVLYQALLNFTGMMGIIGQIKRIVSPFIYGLVMAYLLCPVYNLTVRKTYHRLKGATAKKKHALRISRVIASFVSIIVLVGVVGSVFALVIPETINSVVNLVQIIPERLMDLASWVTDSIAAVKHPEVADFIENIIKNTRGRLIEWSQNEFLPKIGVYMGQIYEGVWVTLKTLMNLIIGAIICVYFLNSKDLFRAQSKKLILAMLRRDKAKEIFDFANFTNRTFGGFINGKLLDSLIIGIICFVAMSILNLPFTVLVSTIIGVTNFIPFFGPIIGAIPSAIIICVESPIQAVYFLILALALQTFDGNILGPKILGDATGLASFWVMFAIIVGGGLFGFVGMVLGVPTFAVIYYYFRRYTEKKLIRKNLPTESAEYEDFNRYNIDRKEVR